jgi:hypothetical protein
MIEDRWNPHVPIPATKPQLGEPLWQTRASHVTWSAELKDRGRWGVEAQIYRDTDFVIGRRFDLRELAVEWAERLRRDVERGFFEEL